MHACFQWFNYYCPKCHPGGKQVPYLKPIPTIHPDRRTSLLNLQLIAVTQQAISCNYPFPTKKKSGKTYQSVKFNAQNFSLMRVAAHS